MVGKDAIGQRNISAAKVDITLRPLVDHSKANRRLPVHSPGVGGSLIFANI